STDSVYVFARLKPEEAIFYKVAHLDNPSFPSGHGRLFIRGFEDEDVNNITSTKQSVTNSTGLLVLASDKNEEFYLHNFLALNNARPIAADDSAATNEATTVVIPVTDNDSDSDGTLNTNSIAIVAQPLNGTIQLGTGVIAYTPNPGFSGRDSLYYTVADDDGENAIAAKVVIEVNDSPVALSDTVITDEDVPVDVPVLANDTDSDSPIDVSTVTVVSAPVNGQATVNPATGVLTYTPDLHYNGSDSLTYTVADTNGGVSNQATVRITVNDINDPPVAVNDTVTTDNATPVIIDVLANDIEVDGTVLPATVNMTTPPANGTATVDAISGEITYTPSGSFFGVDSLHYITQDDDGAFSNTGTVFISVNSVPFAADDSTVTNKGTAVAIDVLANDNDPDGSLNPATVTIISDVSNGSTNVNPSNGSVTYTPAAGFTGMDSFTYNVKDEGGVASNTATVEIKVNEFPTAVNDSVLTLKGNPIEIDILANDSDPDGTLDTASIAIQFNPLNGVVSINSSTGVATYTPNGTFSGTDFFEYRVSDNDGAQSNTATVVVRVNQVPVAQPDAAITSEDTPVNVVVTANDTDGDGNIDETTVTIVTPPANGTATADPVTGVVSYVPNLNFNGTDSFTYTVKDDEGTPSNEATATITVNDINDAPVAINDTVQTSEDQSLVIDVLLNDDDVDGTLNPATVTAPTNSAHGTLSVNTQDGTITYTPFQDFFGQDTFTYTVRDDDNAISNSATVLITVNLVNDPPVAADDAASTDEDNSVDISVGGNDSDIDGSVVLTSVAIASAPGNGTATVNPGTGVVTYTPDADFFGIDSFTYTIDDNNGATSAPGTVTVTVNDINDPPIAVNDTANALFNSPFDISVTLNDIDVDGSIVPSSILASSGQNGTTSIKPNGVITYTPNTGFLGEDSFFYTVRDDDGAFSNQAIVTVFVKVPPVAQNDTVVTNEDVPIDIPVTANDSDQDGTLDLSTVTVVSPPSNGSTSVNTTTGVVTYTPTSNFNGQDSFQYIVSDNDGVASNQATVVVTVNKAPFALNDSRTIDEDTQIAIDVTTNDVDLDGTIDPTSVTIINQPTNGTTTLNQQTGIVTYTPNENFFGTDNFTYIVQDNFGVNTNEALVTIQVNPINDPPVAGNDVVSTNKATPVNIDVTANDVDIDGTVVEASVVATSQPQSGTININSSTGVITYQPNAFFLGVDTFTYTIEDNNGALSNTATVTINVTGDNDPPVAVNDTQTTIEDVPVNINVIGNDTDTDGTVDPTSVSITTPPVHGTATVDPATGVVTYQPDFDFFGEDSLGYQVQDNLGAFSNEARVFITVSNVNDAPVAVNDTAQTDEDTPATLNVILNDSDSDGSLVPGSVQIVDQPDNGSAVVDNVTGEVTYTPAQNYFGSDSLQYTVQDNNGSTSNPATIHLTVNDVNDPPVAVADTVQTGIDTPVNIDVVSNDFDIDGTVNPNTVLVVTPPGNGTTVVQTNGTITYTPNSGFGGSDGFIYSVKDDDNGTSNTALVRVDVIAPPVAVDDNAITNEDVAVDIAVLTNDSDVDGSVVASTVTIVDAPANGQATVNPTTGVIGYTPNVNFFGADTLTYT
ncbi:MAG: cadherin repeat domain-containing protein, partial [Candidatus Zixiibacteriota bacterium]